MSRASRSGLSVNKKDLPIILGMVVRGDRRHDIAAWFGLNQGRIKEVEDGQHGTAAPAPLSELPPSGSPGPRATELRRLAQAVYGLLESDDVDEAKSLLASAIEEFDKND
jgi:hypothetical protein